MTKEQAIRQVEVFYPGMTGWVHAHQATNQFYVGIMRGSVPVQKGSGSTLSRAVADARKTRSAECRGLPGIDAREEFVRMVEHARARGWERGVGPWRAAKELIEKLEAWLTATAPEGVA